MATNNHEWPQEYLGEYILAIDPGIGIESFSAVVRQHIATTSTGYNQAQQLKPSLGPTLCPNDNTAMALGPNNTLICPQCNFAFQLSPPIGPNWNSSTSITVGKLKDKLQAATSPTVRAGPTPCNCDWDLVLRQGCKVKEHI